MGNQRFKLSDMMPNAWFYKLRDMSKVKKKKNMEMQINTKASERRCPSKKRKTVYMPSPRVPASTDIIIDLPPPPISRNSSSSAAAGVNIRRSKPRPRRRRNAHHDEEKTTTTTFYSESFALVKASFDPEKDFKDSMMEMIADNNITASKDLEHLLACYLSLNSSQYHHIIINAFHQIWFTVFTNS